MTIDAARCVRIPMADALVVKATPTADRDESDRILYCAGKLGRRRPGAAAVTDVTPDGYCAMSDFSSWGVPGNLDLKPEIAAPGGNIWSTLTDGTYGSMSGTSMSAPSVTGMAAVVAQYLRETGLAEQEGMTVRALSQALLMSTSSPLKQDNGVEYSPRKQGSGFANVYHAVTTPAYLLTDSKDVTDGKVKVNLGDDPDPHGRVYLSTSPLTISQTRLLPMCSMPASTPWRSRRSRVRTICPIRPAS